MHQEPAIITWNGFAALAVGLPVIAAGVWCTACRTAERCASCPRNRSSQQAAMFSNLMTVLCAESEVPPVINIGTLYN